VKRFILVMSALPLLVASGCATLPSAKAEVKEQASDLAEDLRALGGDRPQTGVSDQAREIESHLGFN